MPRLLYRLIVLLVLLTLPIFGLVLAPHKVGLVTGLLGVGFSGPLLVLYSMFVSIYAPIPQKRILAIVAMAIGVSWTLFVAYWFNHMLD
ncbi:hypothetical protein [Spirosoma luteolum]